MKIESKIKMYHNIIPSRSPVLMFWPALARWLSWLERRPHAPRLWVWSPVRAHPRVNQWLHNQVDSKSMFLSLPVPPPLRPSFPPFLSLEKSSNKQTFWHTFPKILEFLSVDTDRHCAWACVFLRVVLGPSLGLSALSWPAVDLTALVSLTAAPL